MRFVRLKERKYRFKAVGRDRGKVDHDKVVGFASGSTVLFGKLKE